MQEVLKFGKKALSGESDVPCIKLINFLSIMKQVLYYRKNDGGESLESALPKVEPPDIITTADADIAQLVEHRLPKPRVAGSNPVVRSKGKKRRPKRPPLLFFSVPKSRLTSVQV